MPNDKKMKRLEALLDSFDAGVVQQEELIQAIDAVLAIIDQNSNFVADKLIETQQISDSGIKSLKDELSQIDSNLKEVITKVKSGASTSVLEVKNALLQEVRRVEALIPKLPPETDLSAVFNEIEESRIKLKELSVLIIGENIRNSLESLQGDDRLDKSAIRGIEELEELIKEKTSGNQQSFGVRLLKYLADVDISGITNGQTLVWNSTTGKFEAGTATGGSGMSVETPSGTVNSSNTSFTATNTPKFIVTDTGTYVENFGFTLSGLNITMDLAPNSFIRSFY